VPFGKVIWSVTQRTKLPLALLSRRNAATVSLRLFNFVKFEMKPLVLSMNYHRSIYGAVVLFIAGSTSAIAESGIASIYAYSGSKTASGERANPTGFTAAHRTLAFGTHVRVTNRRNGRSVTVRINDRGPFVRGRVIDVTPAGARALGFSSLAPVKLELAQN